MPEMNYKNLTEENEILSADEEKIRLLVGSLKRVAAPKDFDFHLKARIANAKPNDFQPSYFPVLRYVLPLGLVILISAFAVFNSLYFGGSADVPQVAETRPQNQLEERQVISNVFQTSNSADITPGTDANFNLSKSNENKSAETFAAASRSPSAEKLKRKPKTNLRETNPREDISGSHTSALTGSTIIAPPGLNPNKIIKISPEFESVKSLNAKEILSQLGIEAAFTGGNWLVKSVRQNSLAERSGIKSGDAVEALDGVKLTDQPLKGRRIEAKKLTVARGTEKIEIALGGQ